MRLYIKTPYKDICNHDNVTTIDVMTEQGHRQILNNHAPMISKIMKGEITILQNNKKEKITIDNDGILYVKDNVVTIFC